MTNRLIELARGIESRPWNRPGSDKTWVLNAMWNKLLFEREVRRANPRTTPSNFVNVHPRTEDPE